MLSQEENETFTRIGRGTPMGEVLRRYWHPVGMSEYVTSKPKRVKVLGEELVLYRGASGAPVLMQLRCAHRSLALDYGRVEGDSLRCPYHGWLYDKTGQCLEQPAEPEGSSFKEKIKMRSYPTQEVSGLIFAYMGPEPAPLLPLFDLLRVSDGVKDIQVQRIEVNWFNHVENIVDVSHLAWLHGYTFPSYGGKKVSYHWTRTHYGANNVMKVDGIEDTHVSCYGFPTVNRFTLPPIDKSGEHVRGMIMRVPENDVSTLLYFVRFYPSDKHVVNSSFRDVSYGEYTPLESDWWGINVNDQDRMAVEQQGVVADRSNEHLAVSDGGIIEMRKMMREALAAVAAGKDPLCVIRDPAKQNVDFQQSAGSFQDKQEDVGYALGFGQKTQEVAMAK
jgi:5,5'-dehydrodivanillate O-demethylase oxygenase subunit